MRAIAEAPGKVIISGEHFVVHGAVALAAAIARGTRVEATRADGLTVETPFERASYANSGPLPVERLVGELYERRSLRPNLRLKITSTIPTGAGLGSSASTMVATVAAVSKLEGWDLRPEAIADASMWGEKLVHGKPSGVDVAASVLGGVLLFQVGRTPEQISLDEPSNFLVVYSGRRRNTGRLVSKVSSMRQVYPALFMKLCQSASQMSELMAERLVDGRLDELGELMTYNHAALAMVGASNEQLDRLVDLCLQSGCIGAKLTGAGGGGSVLAVARRGEEAAIADRISKEGFDTFIAGVPASGVRAWTTTE